MIIVFFFSIKNYIFIHKVKLQNFILNFFPKPYLKKYKEFAQMVAESVIESMNFPKGLEVAIDFVSEKEIKRLNCEFREIDKVTDVLSFPSFQLQVGEIIDLRDDMVSMFVQENGFVHFGDMALCLKQTKRQAKEFGVSVEAEIKKLVMLYQDFCLGIDENNINNYNVKQEELAKTCLTLSGDTGFSINTCTALREMIG